MKKYIIAAVSVIAILIIGLLFYNASNNSNNIEKELDASRLQQLVGAYHEKNTSNVFLVYNMNDDGKSAHIVITWNTSSTEFSKWEMDIEEDGNKLVYENCKTSKGTYNGDEITSENVVSENEEGYLEISETSSLLWTGSQREDLQYAEFIKY